MAQTQHTASKKSGPVTLNRNGLSVECLSNGEGRLARKTERYDGKAHEYCYCYDTAGRLAEVRLNGDLFESYIYNYLGQRVRQTWHYTRNGGKELHYDEKGRLVWMSMTDFSYDKYGALAKRKEFDGTTRYFYNGDTVLDRVVLGTGQEIRYEYDASNPLLPARRYRNGMLGMEFTWEGPLRLSACRNHDLQVDYAFIYNNSGILDRVRLKRFTGKDMELSREKDAAQGRGNWFDEIQRGNSRDNVHDFLRRNGNTVELYCGCDQVGTLKILTDANGNLVKEILRDSFGFEYHDSFPSLFMPIGFAGGLADQDTGLTRFGYRDYDPGAGRFTAPDPLGDTGGDHDVYEYCVDDPVSMNDPSGLFPPALLLAAGAAGALGLGLGGAYGAAKIVDSVKTRRDGKESTAARDAIKEVTPHVVNIHTNAFLPSQIVLGAATTGVGRVLGAKALIEFLKNAKGDSHEPEK